MLAWCWHGPIKMPDIPSEFRSLTLIDRRVQPWPIVDLYLDLTNWRAPGCRDDEDATQAIIKIFSTAYALFATATTLRLLMVAETRCASLHLLGIVY